MVYAGAHLTDRGLAWSVDRRTWTRDGDGPVITREPFPVPGNARDATLAMHDGTLECYLEIGRTGASGTTVHRVIAPLP